MDNKPDYFLDANNPGMYLDAIPTAVLLFLMGRVIDELKYRESKDES